MEDDASTRRIVKEATDYLTFIEDLVLGDRSKVINVRVFRYSLPNSSWSFKYEYCGKWVLKHFSAV